MTTQALPDAGRAYLEEMLAGIGRGDHSAFTEFYQSTSRRAFGLIRRVLVDPELSEEVLQEVFIMVWKDAAKYQPALGSPLGWLLTIAHRRAVDKVRTYARAADREQRWSVATHSAAYDNVAEEAADRSDVEILTKSLAQLSFLQREAIVLAYFGSLTYKEVAERLAVPLPTVKSRIRGGLDRLRSQLTPALTA